MLWPRAVVFDVDGTLADTEPLAHHAWSTVVGPYGYCPTDGDLMLTRGQGYTAVHHHFASRVPGLPSPTQLWPSFYEHMIDLITSVPLFEDAVGVGRTLHQAGIPLAVATSSPRARLDATLAALDLDHMIGASAAGDEVPEAKPSPAVYLLAARRLGVPAEECLAVEDSDPGVEAAAAAGMKVLAVRREPYSRLDCPTVPTLTLDAVLAQSTDTREAP
jgi:sugar-phosphatase